MEEVSRRIVPINDVGDDRASSYYLASSCTAAGGIDIVMSDGTVTWQGNLEEKDFTLPRGTARADFRARLLQGLSDGPCNALQIISRSNEAIEVRWSSKVDDEAGFAYSLQQVIRLVSPRRDNGQDLQRILGELIEEHNELLRTAECERDEFVKLQEEMRSFDELSARVMDAKSEHSCKERKERFLVILNRKKLIVWCIAPDNPNVSNWSCACRCRGITGTRRPPRNAL